MTEDDIYTNPVAMIPSRYHDASLSQIELFTQRVDRRKRKPSYTVQCTYLSLENSLHSSKLRNMLRAFFEISRIFSNCPTNFRWNIRIQFRNFESVKTIALSKIHRKFGDISFRSKNRWFSSKSGEMFRNSSKFALITFAQYCTIVQYCKLF